MKALAGRTTKHQLLPDKSHSSDRGRACAVPGRGLTDTYGDAYRDYYGVWRWQDYSDSDQRFAARNGWYASHVAREEVLPPLGAALRWMSIQPELQ